MSIATDFPARPATRPAPRFGEVRLRLLGRAAVLLLTSMTGVALFCFWITFVAVSPITIVAPILLPITTAVRAYANIHRHSAQRLLGRPIVAGYREPRRRGLLARIWSIEKDPASWRDAAWLLLHGVVACVTSALSLGLFFGAILYLIYPFLYWVTPQAVFGRPFGGLVHLHSVGQAALMMPLGLVVLGLWCLVALPLTRAELGVTERLLGTRPQG